jgi:vacuolar-type H+-ATPase subunit I/STV1
MVQAIGAKGSTTSSSVLEAQLNKYQIQLADWTACPSGKTPEGKQKIQQIQDKVDTTKSQLQREANASQATAPVTSPISTNAVTAPEASRKTVLGSTGRFLDTFA